MLDKNKLFHDKTCNKLEIEMDLLNLIKDINKKFTADKLLHREGVNLFPHGEK